MDRIMFRVNGKACSAGSEVDSDESLNDVLRIRLNLRGTKYMYKVVALALWLSPLLTMMDTNGHLRLIRQDWEITTTEGLGDRQGYHPIQRTLAEHNGSQCGYWTPGWVMNMYSLLETNNYNLTQYKIENSFGNNNCRCTGYRQILYASITFAKDAPKPNLIDIEELTVIPRSQNAIAQVHAAFLYELDPVQEQRVISARLVFGDLSGPFTHAYSTKNYLKELFKNHVLQSALSLHNDEIVLEEIKRMQTPEFRKKAALGLFYKKNLLPRDNFSKVNVTIPRCGGAYGCKITRAALVSTACPMVTYLLNRPCRCVMDIQANHSQKIACPFGIRGSLEGICMTEHVLERISYELDIDRWKKRGLRVAVMSWPCSDEVHYQIFISIYYGDGSVII
ncbi:unnamed protein product [Pieris brassicae]|uniref:Uncharacterized protein n=1 Tax=Pieris brassicae TaxID=7116 RepID=A0A9P0TZD4_PIEBR|nr:unnamed protein product [Pieris brassicae]